MKTIIAGGRDFQDKEMMNSILNNKNISQVVSGCAKGADFLGEIWAKENKKSIKYFPANWDTYGKRAGFKRNEDMAHYAECAIIFWDGKSKGSKHMIDYMKKLKKPCVIKLYNQEEEEQEW
ncbi:MAG: SLOG family protein [Patescibacteria group bacterium]|nr:SLOG family protein [Patescibacteria group bacterium]